MKDLSFLSKSLIAHRGLHNEKYPENSIGAFKRAIRKGYIIELDLHLTKDNIVVVFHDDNLKRMTGVNRFIKDMTYVETKKLKLKGTNYHIPTFKEVLSLVGGAVPLIIELKYDRKVGLLEKEVSLVLDNYPGDFCVKSFSPFSVFWFRKNRPNYIRGFLISEKRDSFKRMLISHLKFLCKPDFISCNYKLFNSSMIIRYKKKHPVIAWTIRSKTSFDKYKNKFDNLIIEKIDSNLLSK